jgi:hypothetical protein
MVKIVVIGRWGLIVIVEEAIVGDFNRHDQLRGGGDVSLERQGEEDQIIDLMSEFSLSSLLSRGTKTWYNGEHDTTTDLVLASEELKEATVKCAIYGTELVITRSFYLSI